MMKCLIDSFAGFIQSFTLTHRKQRSSTHLHDVTDMGKIDIDHSWQCNELSNSLNSLSENVVCQTES